MAQGGPAALTFFPAPTYWMPHSLRQIPPVLAHLQSAVSGVLVANGVHLVDRIEEADDEGGAERFARFDGPAPEFLDHADVPALVAPRFRDDIGLQRHPRQPRAVFARLRVAQMAGADEPLRDFVAAASVVELFVGREVLEELARRNPS